MTHINNCLTPATGRASVLYSFFLVLPTALSSSDNETQTNGTHSTERTERKVKSCPTQLKLLRLARGDIGAAGLAADGFPFFIGGYNLPMMAFRTRPLEMQNRADNGHKQWIHGSGLPVSDSRAAAVCRHGHRASPHGQYEALAPLSQAGSGGRKGALWPPTMTGV